MGGRWGRRSRLGLEILESYIVSYNTFYVRLLFVAIPLQCLDKIYHMKFGILRIKLSFLRFIRIHMRKCA